MTCPICENDPQPNGYGQPRKCAFDENGVFTSDNWACGTLNLLWKHMGCDQDFHDSDERVRCVFCDLGDFFGIIALQRYKYRGRVQGAIIFNTSQGGTLPLTLDFAQRALKE